MINAFGTRFKILGGVDTLALESIAAGSDGWLQVWSMLSRQRPLPYLTWSKGRIEDALKIYRWFMPLLELDIHPKLVQYIKLAEAAAGVGTENVRPPG